MIKTMTIKNDDKLTFALVARYIYLSIRSVMDRGHEIEKTTKSDLKKLV